MNYAIKYEIPLSRHLKSARKMGMFDAEFQCPEKQKTYGRKKINETRVSQH